MLASAAGASSSRSGRSFSPSVAAARGRRVAGGRDGVSWPGATGVRARRAVFPWPVSLRLTPATVRSRGTLVDQLHRRPRPASRGSISTASSTSRARRRPSSARR
jgi:hypothetical protein